MESEVLRELNNSLSEWGLGRTGHQNAAEHSRLREQITRTVLGMLNETVEAEAEEDDFQILVEEEFPTTVEQAYKHILHQQDFGNVPLFICHDSIKASFAPFFRCHYTSKYKRKDHFQKFQLAQLDPLNRFSFERVSMAELFFHWWFVESDASKLGVFMEAAISCHAIHHEACFHCKHRHSLRWKGGSADAWQDLVCINCQAIYEVKTKETMDQIHRAFENNQIRGGSFRAACLLENSRPSDKKRFLVLLPRNPANKRGQLVHPVQVEEITKILPAACEETFNSNRHSIAIRSVVSVKKRIASLNRNSTRHWFDLPEAVCDRRPRLTEIAKQVFLERFSEEEYERFHYKYFQTNLPPPTLQADVTAARDEPAEETGVMESLRNQLAELDTADDWEDLDWF